MANRVHATCVALGEAGVLLLGASGAGKSDLALRLIDDGARLVADDRVALGVQSGRLVATAPAGLPRALEVRGMGLMPVAMAPSAVIGVAFDLVPRAEIERFPEPVRWRFHDVSVPRYRLDPFTSSAPAKVRLAVALARRGRLGGPVDTWDGAEEAMGRRSF